MNALQPMTALVVEPGLTAMWFVVSALTDSGFHVTVAENFSEARSLIDRHPPTVLVTDVRLGEYNGLHLVIRRNAGMLTTAAVVVTELNDTVLQAETERLGATFVVLPTSKQEFIAAICRTIFRAPAELAAVRPVFERRVMDRRAEAMIPPADMSGVPQERRVVERRRNFGSQSTISAGR